VIQAVHSTLVFGAVEFITYADKRPSIDAPIGRELPPTRLRF